jgi:ABC-type nitrate/sulfonate/bicarbonate transport system substrate-binding protein
VPEPLRIAYGAPVVLTIPLWAAYEGGFFRTYGFDAGPPQLVGGGARAVSALISGEIDLVGAGGYPTALAVGSGAGIRMVAVANIYEPFIIYTREKLPSPHALVGARVATSGAASESRIAFELYLEKVGLPASEVTYLDAGNTSGQVAALISGAATAGALNPPIPQQIATQLFVLADLTPERIPWITTGFDVSAQTLHDHPDRVLRMVAALEAGAHFALLHEGFTERVVQKYMKITDPRALAEAYSVYKTVLAPELAAPPTAVANIVRMAASTSRNPEDRIRIFYSSQIIDALRANGFLQTLWYVGGPGHR